MFFMFAKYIRSCRNSARTGDRKCFWMSKSGDRDEMGRERLKFILKRIEATREKKAKEPA